MPYAQMQTEVLPIAVVSTDDVFLELADGRRLIDGMASWWTACHGYNHPRIVEAMHQQLDMMPHVMFGGIHHPQALKLATRLANLLPGDLNHAFFCDSGSVAVEVAMKMAVQFWINRGKYTRKRFVSFKHGYHGDTAGAMSVCDPDNSMHAHFKGFLLEQFSQAVPNSESEFAHFDSFLDQKKDTIAAVIIEPLIQGAGGMKFHSPRQLTRIQSICKRHGLLFIADEIATGFGRTGTMFACDQADIVPDIICIGKALTGGAISLAATVASREIYDAFLSDEPSHALMHGPTYMANPLACAAANASLDLFETEPRLEQVAKIEAIMSELLAPCSQLDGIVEVRCKGAVGVIQVQQLGDLPELRQTFIDAGIWLRPFGDMIYMTPSLTISEKNLQTLCNRTSEVVHQRQKSFVIRQ